MPKKYTIEVEADRDDDDDQVELETDADRYPRPKGDEADAFDIHDNTIGYDHPDEDGDEENFPEPDDIAPIEPASVAVQPVAPAPVTPPAEQRTPASQSVLTLPPSARLPRRRPPATSTAAPAHSEQLPLEPAAEISPSAGEGLKPRTGMGFIPTTLAGYADLSPEAIKNATWEKPVPMTMAGPEPRVVPSVSAARPSAASAEHHPAEPHLRPIRRPAWLGTIADEDPPD